MSATATGPAARAVPEDLAEKLIAGTDRLVVGFEDVRMDDIAKASGIPRATLYYHFPSRRDVLAFLHDAMLAEFRRTVLADGEGTARERLVRLFDRLFEHIRRHPGAAQILVSNIGQLGKLSELTTGTFDPLIDEIGGIVGDGVASGELRGDVEVRPTAHMMSTMAHVTTTRVLVAGELDQSHAISEWLVGLLWDGVAASTAAPTS